MTVSTKIDRALVAERLSIAQAAEKAGVSARTFYKVRRAERNVSRETVTQVADAIGLDPVELWDSINPPANLTEDAR